jgi:L-asparaginase II
MGAPQPVAELWRGGRLESQHLGHAVVVDGTGALVEGWGDPSTVIFPRSSCKMIQALPLIESGAAAAAGLSDSQLALACASHSGAAIHTRAVEAWLATIGLGEADLRCGAHWPGDLPARDALIREGGQPCQIHNNCSGKHTGFLTLARHLGAGPEYVEIDHPVQRAVRAAFEETTGETSPGYGIDGCSAPNFACTLAGLGRAMARFAAATEADTRGRAMVRLRQAMASHPEMVAGEGRACTDLMRAMEGVAVKTGAEAVYVAILPAERLGIALKIADGGTRGAELAIAELLVRAGVLDPDHPAARRLRNAVQVNWRGIEVGVLKAAAGFPGP